MNWFTRVFQKAEWRLCGTLEMGIVKPDELSGNTKGTLYYYLYEDQHGNRKFDVGDTIRGDTELKDVSSNDVVYRSPEYLTKVKPWLDGRKIPGISAYNKVKHHDLVRTLKEGD